jgi:hypothetical protein
VFWELVKRWRSENMETVVWGFEVCFEAIYMLHRQGRENLKEILVRSKAGGFSEAFSGSKDSFVAESKLE